MTLADRCELAGDASELTLELARRSHEPGVADRARNLAALRNRLGLPVPPSGASSPPAGSANGPPAGSPLASSPLAGSPLAGSPLAGSPLASSPLAGSPVPPAAARSLGLAPWHQLLGVGVLTGAIGFFVGLGVREQRAPALPLARVDLAAQPASAVTTPAVAAPNVAAPNVPAPAVGAPNVPMPAPNASAPNVPARAVAPPRKPRKTPPRAAQARRGVPAAATAERSDPELLEAVRLLARARRALARQEPALALGLLDELDARFARQLLDEERAATRVLALCASGEPAAASELARSWFSDRPRSIYMRRLEQSCAGEALRR